MSSVFRLVETLFKVFGNAPQLFLSIISHYRTSDIIKSLASPSMSRPVRRSIRLSEKVGREPEPEPPAAPPIIILSQNSNGSGSQPQERDPGPPYLPTSFPPFISATPSNETPDHYISTADQLKPKPEPEPHPAPPVIILAHNKRPASSSPTASPPASPQLQPQIPSVAEDRTHGTSDFNSKLKRRAMGSKASRLAPKNGKLQSSQEKKDKEEMKEPTNYYTHRSKSMRRKAGKDASAGDAAGGIGSGSGGVGGAI